MATYRAVIAVAKELDADTANIDIEDTSQFDYYEADVIEPLQVNLTTQITSHPLVNGNVLSDHMIIQPTTLTLKGSFSLSGSKFTEYAGEKERLANIEQTFESVMKEGRFCRVVTIGKEDNGSRNGKIRFIQRDNLVLNNISWTEHLNSLDFTFGFVECLTATIVEIEYAKDVRDPNLPDLTEPAVLDFSDKFVDVNAIMKWLEEYVKNNNIQKSSTYRSRNTAHQIGGYIVSGALVIIGVVCCCTGVGAAVGIPLIIAGVGAGVGTYAASQSLEEQAQNAEQIENAQAEAEDAANSVDWSKMKSEVFQQLDLLEQHIKVYGITSNTSQECLLSIDDEYYIFIFTKQGEGWSLKVQDIGEKDVAQQGILTGIPVITECGENDQLFRTTAHGLFVYVVNPVVGYLQNIAAPQHEIDAAKNNLTNYVILVSDFNMSKYSATLEKILKNAVGAK